MKVRGGEDVQVGDFIRILARAVNDGPPVGAVLPVLKIATGSIYVPWVRNESGMYGKMPMNIERVGDADTIMDLGL